MCPGHMNTMDNFTQQLGQLNTVNNNTLQNN